MSKGKTIAIVLAGLGGCALLVVVACGGLLYMGYRSADTAVSPRIDEMFAAIEAGSFADTYETHTTGALRQSASKQEYTALGNAIALRLGELKSKSLRAIKMRQHNASSYVEVSYAATFDRGSGTIDAQLEKEGSEWKFVSFRVNSPVFAQALAGINCSECGEPHEAGARFCPSCGAAVQSGDKIASPVEPLTES